MVGIRKSLDCFFTESELRILDDILPSFTRRKQLDDEDRKVRKYELTTIFLVFFYALHRMSKTIVKVSLYDVRALGIFAELLGT